MKKISSKQNGNVFTTIVRDVVKEELIPVRGEINNVREEIVRVEKRLDGKIDYKIDQLRDELHEDMHGLRSDILSMKDEIMGELKTVREEQIILSSQHSRVVDLEEKMESLEKIHPQGQHVVV